MPAVSPSQRFFRMALFAALYAFVLVVLSAWWRAAESGLGCPEWPGCYGRLFAPLTPLDVNEARSYFPRQPAEEERLLKETLHRYFSGALGLLMFPLVKLGWQLKKRVRRQQVLIPGLVFVLVFTQITLGILTVRLAHKPVVAMLHLAAGLSILGLLWWVVLREQRFWRPVTATPAIVLRRLRLRALIGLILVAAVVVSGGWLSANYAALACPDFPTCQGSWWPAMDIVNGFTLWRDVGLEYEGVLLNLEAATAIHMGHRLGALAAVLYVGWLALHAMRVGARDNLCRFGLLVFALLLVQLGLGIMAELMHLPVVMVVAHSAAGALLLLALITLNHAVRPRPRE